MFNVSAVFKYRLPCSSIIEPLIPVYTSRSFLTGMKGMGGIDHKYAENEKAATMAAL